MGAPTAGAGFLEPFGHIWLVGDRVSAPAVPARTQPPPARPSGLTDWP